MVGQPVHSALPSQHSANAWQDRALVWFFSFFLFASVFLPSGSFYHVNIKYPLYVGLLPLSVWSLVYRRRVSAGELAGGALAVVFLLAWLLLGIGYNFPPAAAVRQFTDMLLLLLLCCVISIYTAHHQERRRSFLLLVLYAVLASALMKGALIAYAVVSGTPLVELLLLINKIFDVDLMTMDINDLLGRIQFYSDFLIPVCVYVVLRYRDQLRIGLLTASVSVILLLASALLSFSRFLWAFTAFAFLIGLLFGKRDRFNAVLIVCVCIAALATLPFLIDVYQLRFSSEVTGSSDSARTEQVAPLESFFQDAPIFGHGFGSYTTTLLRSDTEPMRFSYELQLLALLGQIGLIGTALLACAAAWYFKPLWWRGTLALQDRVGLGMLLLFWISAGLTNPLLFQTVAAVNYAMIFSLAGFRPAPRLTMPGLQSSEA